MTDIVERLRAYAGISSYGSMAALFGEAADEIEALRGEIEPLQKALEVHAGYAAEIERLRTAMPRLFRSLITLHAFMSGLWRSDEATAKFLGTSMAYFNHKTPLLYMLEGGQPAIDKTVEWFRRLGDGEQEGASIDGTNPSADLHLPQPEIAVRDAEIHRLRDEIERLRAALREIADSSNDPRAVREARAALRAKVP